MLIVLEKLDGLWTPLPHFFKIDIQLKCTADPLSKPSNRSAPGRRCPLNGRLTDEIANLSVRPVRQQDLNDLGMPKTCSAT